jgi:hypothetical protein
MFAGELDELQPLDTPIAQMTVTITLAESKRSSPTESEGNIATLVFIGTSGIMIPLCSAGVQSAG